MFRCHRNTDTYGTVQAIYLHTGDADLAVAEYTTDADFAISPVQLAGAPLLDELLMIALIEDLRRSLE